jgi:hypothetical protein
MRPSFQPPGGRLAGSAGNHFTVYMVAEAEIIILAARYHY